MPTLSQTDSSAIKSETSTPSALETIVADLNFDGKVDTCYLMNSSEDGDPGEFREILISLTDGFKTKIESNEVWNHIDSTFLVENRQNAINSKRVYAYKDHRKTYLLFFGYHFGTGREFQIVEIDGFHIRKIFNEEFDDIVYFGKEGKDDRITLIVRRSPEMYSMVDSLNADIGTYDPYYVYKYGRSLVLDESASEAYNIEKYLWKGLKLNDSIKVLYPRSGERPRFID